MTSEQHLPECIYTPESFDSEQNIVWGGKPCICPALRACETRAYSLGIEVGKHDGWLAGRADGLDAAREAVAAMWQYEQSDSLMIGYNRVLETIDALRDNSGNRANETAQGNASPTRGES